MNILLITESELSGEWIATERLLKETRTQNRNFSWSAFGFGRKEETVQKPFIRILPHAQHRRPLGTLRNVISDTVRMGIALYHEMKRHHYDLLVSTTYPGTLAAILVGKIFHVPALHLFHGWRSAYAIDGFRQSLQERLIFTIEISTIRNSPGIVVFSKASELQLKHYLPAITPTLLPRAIPAHFFQKPKKQERENIQRRVAKRIGKPIVFYCGRIVRYKGLPELSQACQDLIRDVQLIIATPKSSVDPEIYESLQKANPIILFDVEESLLPALYHEATLSVLPSQNEQAPLVMLEALASETLFLGTKVGDMETVLSAIDPRLLLPSGSPEDIKKTLLWAIALSPSERHILTRKGKQIAQQFRIDLSATTLYHTMEKMLTA